MREDFYVPFTCHIGLLTVLQGINQEKTHKKFQNEAAIIISCRMWEVVAIGKPSMEIEGLSEIYKEFALLIGVDNTYRIFESFSGQQITFPVKWLSKDYVAFMAANRYDGNNLRHLAREYGYSERWLRQIIKNQGVDDAEV